MAPSDTRLSRATNTIFAAPAQSLEAAADRARGARCKVVMLGDPIEGEAREVAKMQAAQVLTAQCGLAEGAPPDLLLSGGELTVTRTGDGVGGPNAEFCLALAIALAGSAGFHAIACDTDGIDGVAEVAGAVVGPGLSLERVRQGKTPRKP